MAVGKQTWWTRGIWLCFTRLRRARGREGLQRWPSRPRNQTHGGGNYALVRADRPRQAHFSLVPALPASGTTSQCRKSGSSPSAVGLLRKTRVLHPEPGVMEQMFEKCAACLRGFLDAPRLHPSHGWLGNHRSRYVRCYKYCHKIS